MTTAVRVFLSHKSEDESAAKAAAVRLQQRGLEALRNTIQDLHRVLKQLIGKSNVLFSWIIHRFRDRPADTSENIRQLPSRQ